LSTTGTTSTSITIAAAAGQNPNVSSSAAVTTSRCTVTSGTGATPSASCTWAGSPYNATIDLTANAAGPGTLTYQWSVTGGPSGSSITNGSSSSATLNIVKTGTYTVQLFVDNGALSAGTTVTKNITVTANRTFAANVVPVFSNVSYGCTGCHAFSWGGNNPDPSTNSGIPPSWVSGETDSNGKTLYQRVFDRINTATPVRSLLLLNPLNVNNGFNDNPVVAPNVTVHGGGQLFSDENDAAYITFLTWIVGGALNN
jgi:hypothetical protein